MSPQQQKLANPNIHLFEVPPFLRSSASFLGRETKRGQRTAQEQLRGYPLSLWGGMYELLGPTERSRAGVPHSLARQLSSMQALQRGLADQLYMRQKTMTSQSFPSNSIFSYSGERVYTLFSSKTLHSPDFRNNYCSSSSGTTNRDPCGARAHSSPVLLRASPAHQSPDGAPAAARALLVHWAGLGLRAEGWEGWARAATALHLADKMLCNFFLAQERITTE